MRPTLQVAEDHGVPIAQVPQQVVWDLVEYLAMHRIRVMYSYDSLHFTVRFPHTDPPTAQRMLDEWVTSDAMANGE